MGIFEKVFKTSMPPAINQRYEMFAVQDGHFSSWNKDLYGSDLVRSAINARATAISKLELDVTGNAKMHTINCIKHKPNQYSTWSQLLYRVSTILDNTNTCFIVPSFDKYGEINALYPVLPATCKVVTNSATNIPWLQYDFVGGKKRCVELEKVAILTKYQFKNEFFGSTNNALDATLELIHLNQQSIKEGIDAGTTFRFMGTLKHTIKDEDLEKEQNRFNKSIFKKGRGGMLLIPSLYENVKQVDCKPYNIDSDQLEYIRTSIYNYFGVNEKILQNTATSEEQAAFYDTVVTTFAIQISEALTNLIYTEREKSAGNKIQFKNNRLSFMNDSQKIRFVTMALDRGFMMIDEGRELMGLAPLPDGSGQRCIARGEYKTVGAAADALISNVTGNEKDNNLVDMDKLNEINNETKLDEVEADKISDEVKLNADL